MTTPPLMTCGCRAQGTHTDRVHGEVPCCVVHSCTEVKAEPDLAGRTARCSCGKTFASDASDAPWEYLPFFEFRGPGSPAATEKCKVCRYHEVAHEPRRCTRCDGSGVYPHSAGITHGTRCPRCDGTGTTAPAAFMRGAGGHGVHDFEPHGAWDTDIFYCGCRGWD